MDKEDLVYFEKMKRDFDIEYQKIQASLMDLDSTMKKTQELMVEAIVGCGIKINKKSFYQVIKNKLGR